MTMTMIYTDRQQVEKFVLTYLAHLSKDITVGMYESLSKRWWSFSAAGLRRHFNGPGLKTDPVTKHVTYS